MEITTNDDVVSIKDLQKYIAKLSLSAGLTTSVQKVIYDQIAQLEIIYGKDINRETAIRILQTQIEMTRTGYFQEPVGIVEFVESYDYMNQKKFVRPRVLADLVKLWRDPHKYTEVVLGGAIGWGKNYFLDMSMAYFIYRMSCLYSPQAHFGLAPGSDIVFLFQSKTYDSARKVIFNQFKQRIEASKYFTENYMFEKRSSASELKFPNNVRIRPVSSSDTAALSLNVLAAVIDEANFLNVIKRSVKVSGPHQETYDQAQKLYQTVYDRIESRYKTSTGILGKVFLMSSANYEGDFIDRKEKEAITNPKIFVAHMSQWEAAPWKYSTERFYVKLPTRSDSAHIVDDKPADMTGYVAVPVDLKQDFISNPEESLRSKAGIAIISQHKFLSLYDVAAAHKAYLKTYSNVQIFKKRILCINTIDKLEDLINWDFVEALVERGPFVCHIDLGITTDAAGVAIGHVVGGLQSQNVNAENVTYAPIYGLPGLLACVPPANAVEDIDIIKIRDLVFLLAKVLPIEILTMDQFQSDAILQEARRRGFRTHKVSVDKTPDPYIDYKQATRERRVLLPSHKELDAEYRGLDQDLMTGKIDHAAKGSKDIADAVTAAVHTLALLRSTYTSCMTPVPIIYGKDLPIPDRQNQGNRRSSGDRFGGGGRWSAGNRPSSGNR